MRALAFLGKLIPFVRRGKSTSRSKLLDDKFYEQLFSRDRRLAEAARDVKASLASGKSSRALTICDQTLVRYPGQPLFEGLRLEVENQQRQSRLEYIQRICTDLETIPNLEWRISRLEQALSRFPTESQLAQLLRNSKAKRDFVNLLLDQARHAESCDKYEDALELWYTLRECHPIMPGLHGEVQRLESMRYKQERLKRKKEFLADICGMLTAKEYERAVNQCASAISEFPNDDELLTLQKSAQERSQRAAEIQGLIQDGLSFLDRHQADAALRSFRTAGRLDQSNPQVSHLLGAALISKIKAVINTDPRTANLLLEEAIDVVPDHPELERLFREIQNRRQNESGDQHVLLTDGLSGAMHEDLLTAQSDSTIEAPQRGSFLRDLKNRAGSCWLRIREQIKAIPDAAIMDYRWLESKKAIIALATVGSIGVALIGYTLSKRPGNSEQAVSILAPTALNIAAFPEGAEIFIDGQTAGRSQFRTTLAPGDYTVSVAMAGYEPQTLPLTLASVPRTLNVTLQPIPLDLHIVTDQRSGRVWMDDEPKGELSPEGITISGVAPGMHRLRVSTPEGEVRTTFDFRPENLPVPISLPTRRIPAVLFVGSSNERSRVECNCAPAQFRVNDSQQTLEARGLELDLLEGDYPAELSIMGGKRLVIQGSRAPVATVGLYWGEETSIPVVSTDNLLREANTLISNRQYQAALARVSQVLSRSPSDDRAPILRKRLERLMAIDP